MPTETMQQRLTVTEAVKVLNSQRLQLFRYSVAIRAKNC
jgi:hypothetical protein